MPLDNGTIVIEPFTSSLNTWALSSQTGNVILLATLTTLLSYQLAATIFDLLLGFKPQGTASAPAIQSLLLAQELSTLSTIAAILRVDVLDRLRFRPRLPGSVELPRLQAKIQIPVLIPLIGLIIAAPITNLLAVILTVEREYLFAFKDVPRNGLAVSLDANLVRQNKTIRFGQCVAAAVKIPPGGFRQQSDFLLCRSGMQLRTYKIVSPPATPVNTLSISANVRGVISARVDTPATLGEDTIYSAEMKLHGTLRTDHHGTFRVAQDLNVELALKLLKLAAPQNVSTPQLREPEVLGKHGEILFTVSQSAYMPIDAILEEWEKNATRRVALVLDRLSFVEAPALLLAHESEATAGAAVLTFEERGELPFLSRRGKVLDQGFLIILVGAVLAVRLIVGMFTRNDVERGLEMTIKSYLGLHASRSLLRCDEEIHYHPMCYNENLNQYRLYQEEPRGVGKQGSSTACSEDSESTFHAPMCANS